MRKRHWDAISKATRGASPAFTALKLGKVLDMNLHEHAREISGIVHVAVREDRIEATLAKLHLCWKYVDFALTAHEKFQDKVLLVQVSCLC
jgi:hypothetical protein